MQVAGDWQLLELVGRGASGSVYRARSREGAVVAVKVVPRVDGQARARFERERRLQERLGAEEGFVPLLDSGDFERGSYFVMPFLEGGTLRARLAHGPLPVDEVADLGRDLAGALARAHVLGIVHRDVKPENVLFDAGGRPLLADLGIAKHFDRRADDRSLSITEAGEVRGTIAYAPPEQFSDASSVGPRSDVYALGAVLYECLAGRAPYDGDSVPSLVAAVLAGNLVPVSGLRPDAPRWLAAVIERSLAVDPARRPADGADLARALGGPRRRLSVRVLAVALAGAALASVAVVFLARPAPAASRARDARAALAHELRAVETDPTDAAAWNDLAMARERLGERDAAIEALTRAIAAKPDLGLAWRNRAVLRERKGDAAGALEDYTRAIAVEPRHPLAWHNRGAMRARAGDLEGALADQERAVEVDPSYASAWRSLAAVRDARGDYRGARAAHERALALEPDRAKEWAALGIVRARLDDAEGAIDAYTRSVALDPRDAQPWRDRGGLRWLRGDRAGARADFARALEADPRNAATWYNLGVLEERTGDRAAAVAAYTKALEADPSIARAWCNRGSLRVSANDDEGAMSDLTRAIELNPRYALALMNRGVLLERKGDHQAAVADLTMAIENGAEPVAWYARGRSLRALGREAEAVADYERFIELAPSHPSAEGARQWLAKRAK